jgi:hypothetical protein
MNDRARQLATIALTVIVLVGVNIQYTAWAIGRNNEPICEVLATGTEPPPRPPAGVATTPVGEDLQRYNRELAVQQARKLASVKNLQRKYDC